MDAKGSTVEEDLGHTNNACVPAVRAWGARASVGRVEELTELEKLITCRQYSNP